MLDGYRRTEAVFGDYVDTGILAQSGLTIDAVVDTMIDPETRIAAAVFGARDGNYGQINIYQYNSGFYFGYNNGRLTVAFTASGSLNDSDESCRFTITDNSISINQQCVITKTGSRTAATFTGSRNIYVGAVNNGGTADISPFYTRSFAIYQNGTLVKDYVACERIADGVFGLYDLVNDVFESGANNSFQSSSRFLIQEGTHTNGKIAGNFGYLLKTTLTAYADTGYAFAGWYINNRLYTLDNPMTFKPDGPSLFTIDAVFVKKFEDDFRVPWKLFARSRYDDPIFHKYDGVFYEMRVTQADINEDGLEKAVSTFVVESIPSAVKVDMLVMLYTPRGRKYYQGVIESIDETTLVCREALAYFDAPYLFHNNTNNSVLAGGIFTNMTQLNVQYVLECYIRSLAWGIQNTDNSSDPSNERYNYAYKEFLYRDNFTDVNFPLISGAEVMNFEQFLFEMFNQFGVLVNIDYRLEYPQVSFTCDYDTSVLTLGDNTDVIANLNIEIKYTDANLVFVFNSSGSSFRGLLNYPGVDTNTEEGTIPSKQTMIMSDDSMNTLQSQYVTNDYNHKITFQIRYPNEIINIDEMKIGQRVRFYNGGNLYDSIITGRSYSITTSEDIREVKYTLGKARSSLTSKLNQNKPKVK